MNSPRSLPKAPASTDVSWARITVAEAAAYGLMDTSALRRHGSKSALSAVPMQALKGIDDPTFARLTQLIDGLDSNSTAADFLDKLGEAMTLDPETMPAGFGTMVESLWSGVGQALRSLPASVLSSQSGQLATLSGLQPPSAFASIATDLDATPGARFTMVRSLPESVERVLDLQNAFGADVRIDAIQIPELRRCASALAEVWHSGRQQTDPNAANLQEIHLALDAFASKDPTQREKLAAAKKRAPNDFTRENVERLANYLQHGEDDILRAFQALVPVSGELKPLDCYELPTTARHPTTDDAEAMDKLVNEYKTRFARRVGYDLVFLQCPESNRLFVALNDHGSLNKVYPGQRIQTVDAAGQQHQSLEVVTRPVDERNSVAEIASLYGSLISTAVEQDLDNQQNSSGLGALFTQFWEKPLTLALTGATIVATLGSGSLPLLPMLAGALAGFAAPGLLHAVRNLFTRLDRGPILNAAGVTTMAAKVR